MFVRPIGPCATYSNQAVTTKSLPAKTSVLCPVVQLGVLIENCFNFQGVNFLIDTGSQISLIDSGFLTKIHKKKPKSQFVSVQLAVKYPF